MKPSSRRPPVGPLGGTPLINGGTQAVTYAAARTLVAIADHRWLDRRCGCRLNAGDVFTIANVFAVNPNTKQSTGRLRRLHRSCQRKAPDGAGNLTATISPPIITSGRVPRPSARSPPTTRPSRSRPARRPRPTVSRS